MNNKFIGNNEDFKNIETGKGLLPTGSDNIQYDDEEEAVRKLEEIFEGHVVADGDSYIKRMERSYALNWSLDPINLNSLTLEWKLGKPRNIFSKSEVWSRIDGYSRMFDYNFKEIGGTFSIDGSSSNDEYLYQAENSYLLFSGGKNRMSSGSRDALVNNVDMRISERRGELSSVIWGEVINRVNDANDTNDRLEYPWIHLAAGFLLANLRNGNTPYSLLSWDENSWLWIKALLGRRHFDHFMEEKKNCTEKLKLTWNNQEKNMLQGMLDNSEMDYIINNVLWANGRLIYFGFCEGKDWRNNPSKTILTEDFANELKELYYRNGKVW